MERQLVSIIMPAFNASATIAGAIGSVITQTYPYWELLIVNDGSTDDTLNIINSIQDSRITVITQHNRGVSVARNQGLKAMKGDYFCFLDADDILPPNSILARLEIFGTGENVAFVDGCVETRNYDLSEILRVYKPTFKGYPRKELIGLKDTCFFGPTWMIRNKRNTNYKMKEGMTHGEDLLFYIENGDQGLYNYTEETVLYYRKSSGSAMANIDGLFNGYKTILRELQNRTWAGKKELLFLRIKICRIIVLSYWKKNRIGKGLNAAWDLIVWR